MKEKATVTKEFFVPQSLCTEEPVLAGSRCKLCGKIFFPNQDFCSNCLKHEMKEVPLSRKGKLHTYTIVRVGPSEFKTPYAIGYVDLPEGVRICSQLTDCEPFDKVLREGMEMEVTLGIIKMDKSGKTISYKFRPIKGKSK